MQKGKIFESIDMLGSPYEAFLFDTEIYQLPMKPHWHYFMEILYIVEGNVLIECDNGNYFPKSGDMILFYPRMVHTIYAATDKRIQYYVLKFDVNRLDYPDDFSIPKFSILIDHASHDKNIPICLVNESIKKIPFADYFATCIEEISTKNYGYDILVHSTICRLMTEVIRIWNGLGIDMDKSLTIDNDVHSIDNILEFIDAHATEKLQVKDLAAECNISYSFFAKKFREFYGRSCKEYIEFIRICKAETLLLFTNNDLNSVSQETGFSDCSHLIKTFKKWKGITPKQYALHYKKQTSE